MKEMIARVGDRTNKDGIESVCLTTEEIVRCKDCKHYENCEVNDLLLNHEDGYCSDGEKRTD